MKSLRKVSLVLSCFSADHPRLSLQAIADHTCLPKTTVHRILASLREIDFIVQDDNRDDYRLGLRFLPLSGIVLSDLDVPKHARRPAAILMNQCGESVHVCVFDGRNVISIDRHEMAEDSNEIIRLEREPAYCTGTGKAVLAALPEETVRRILPDKMESYTSTTITDPELLVQELAATRKRGYSIDNEERQPGVRCIGAAIRNRRQVVGAISVTGPAGRLPPSRIPVLAGLAMATAARISASIENA